MNTKPTARFHSDINDNIVMTFDLHEKQTKISFQNNELNELAKSIAKFGITSFEIDRGHHHACSFEQENIVYHAILLAYPLH